ncbi:hypothetical protein [Streptomyces sp. NPDC018693]|uniref:hypothetical protein n=1 Tax=unclassified Streptomyces TaxID=2593676 RepID=UPI0037A492BD
MSLAALLLALLAFGSVGPYPRLRRACRPFMQALGLFGLCYVCWQLANVTFAWLGVA